MIRTTRSRSLILMSPFKSCLCLIFCCFLQQAYAATYLIDFGVPTNETTTADGNGNLWNNLSRINDSSSTPGPNNQRIGSINLISTAGEAGFTMEYSYPTSGINFDSMNGFPQTSNNLPNLGLLNVNSAKNDGIWSRGPVSLIFSGLDPTLTYSFSLFAHRVNDPSRSTNFQLVGETSSSVVTINVANTVNSGGQLVEFLNYKPDASGNITMTLTAGSGGFTYLNAMQIVATPEPSQCLLLLVGSSVMVVRRRRIFGTA